MALLFLLFGLTQLGSASFADEGVSISAGQDVIELEAELRPLVKTLSRPIETYHYVARETLEAQPSNEGYVQQLIKYFWNREQRPSALGDLVSAFYVATDPVVSKHLGGENPALFAVTLPEKMTFLDVRTHAWSNAAKNRLARLGCLSSLARALFLAPGNKIACRNLSLIFLEDLGVSAVAYHYAAVQFKNCPGRNYNNAAAFFIVKQSYSNAELFLSPQEYPARIRGMIEREEKWVEPWMEDRLFGCGNYAEDRLP